MNHTPSRTAYSNHTLSLRGVVLAGVVALTLVMGCSQTPVPPPEATRSSSLRVVSYNVRYADADAGEGQMQSHAEAVATDIRALSPDIACLQEVMTGLYPASIPSNPFRDRLADVLEGFSWAAARDDSHLEDANSVLYDPDRFTPIRQGLHWFSDTPMTPDSRAWGNEVPRNVNWVLFYDAVAERHLFVANLHLDHMSRRMNHRALRELPAILQREATLIGKGRIPIVVCGDFNEPAAGRALAPMRDNFTSALSPGDGDTRRDLLPFQIDGIYVSPTLGVGWAAVDRHAGASDHRPVVAELIYDAGSER